MIYTNSKVYKGTVAELGSRPHCGDSPGSSRSKTSVKINVDEMYYIAEICGTVLMQYTLHQQGRRHGFESGGTNSVSEFFLTPTFWAMGDKILLR